MKKETVMTVIVILAALIGIIGIQPEFQSSINIATTFQSVGGDTSTLQIPTSSVTSSEATSGVTAANQLLEKITYILLGFAATVAIFFIVRSGFMMMTARGDEEGVKKARETMLWAIIGFGLIIIAYGLVINIGQIIYDLLSKRIS